MQPITRVLEALDAFTPRGDEDADVDRLSEIVDDLSQLADRSLAIPAIFALLERCEAADLGSPGPLVHTLEAMEGYAAELRVSLERRPTPLTLWMVNRILNGRPGRERAGWLVALESAASHPRASSASRQEALGFLRHQAADGPARH